MILNRLSIKNNAAYVCKERQAVFAWIFTSIIVVRPFCSHTARILQTLDDFLEKPIPKPHIYAI